MTPAPTAPTIDPRIVRRRVEVTRDEGRRRMRLLLVLVAVAVVVGLGALATRSPLLQVRHLDVVGARATDPLSIQRAAQLDGLPMTDVDGAAAARRVRALPWIDTARVRRRWPTTVQVLVTERAAAATTEAAGGGWATLDAAGHVLAVGAARPKGLPRVTGIPPAGAAGTRLDQASTVALGAAAALPPVLAGRTADVHQTPSDDVELHLDGGGTVRLGNLDDLSAKYTAAATVLGRADLKAFKILDVRVPDAPVLTRS